MNFALTQIFRKISFSKNTAQLLLFVVGIIILDSIGGYFYLKSKKTMTPEEQNLKNLGDASQTLTESVTQGVLPGMDVNKNLLEDAPDVNPATKTNPLSGIKTNPFR